MAHDSLQNPRFRQHRFTCPGPGQRLWCSKARSGVQCGLGYRGVPCFMLPRRLRLAVFEGRYPRVGTGPCPAWHLAVTLCGLALPRPGSMRLFWYKRSVLLLGVRCRLLHASRINKSGSVVLCVLLCGTKCHAKGKHATPSKKSFVPF